MTINATSGDADGAPVTGFTRRAFDRRANGDAGVSMIEMLVALVIIAIVSAASAAFIVNDIRGVDGQKQRQQAVYVADQTLEQARSLAPTYITGTTRSKLVNGRTKASVQTLLASAPASALGIASQDDVTTSLSLDWDPVTGDSLLIPTNPSTTVNGTTYTSYNFVDVCWETGSTSLTAGQASSCGPTQTAGTTELYRVTTDVTWKGNGSCSTGCAYSDSTLIDPTIDQQFNNNVSLPAGAFADPANSQTIIDNQNGTLTNNLPCAVSGQTGDQMTITGSNLQSGLSVKISPGGGTVYNVLQPSAGTITFCLTTSNNPGQYTVTIINPDFGLFKLPLTEEPYISTAGSYNAAAKTLVITGDGFENDATVTCAGSLSCGTATWNSATQMTLSNYIPPTNGATGNIVVNNPDDGTVSAAWTITAPNLAFAKPAVKGFSIATGLSSTPPLSTGVTTATVLTVASGSPLPTLTALNSSLQTTMTVASTFSGSTFNVTATNPDGGSDTFAVTVDAAPTITSFTTTVSSIRHSTTFGLTSTGTGYSTTAPGPTLTATWTGPSPSTSSVTTTTVLTLASSTSAGYTVTAPPALGTYTLRITITNPDGGSVVSSTTKTMTVT
jgi:prepilin-type N-terminal cleavage/methylation domain-containing protein